MTSVSLPLKIVHLLPEVHHEQGQLLESRLQCDPILNWLQVSGTAERSQVDQRVRHQLHAIVPLLDAFKTEQQPLELIFPRKGPLDPHPQRMDGGVEEALTSTLGVLTAEVDHPNSL